MSTFLEQKFAKAIYDTFLGDENDWNKEKRIYYCEFCDAAPLTAFCDEMTYQKACDIFEHDPNCVVNDAKKVIMRNKEK